MLPRMDVAEEPRKNFPRGKLPEVPQVSSSDEEDVDDCKEN